MTDGPAASELGAPALAPSGTADRPEQGGSGRSASLASEASRLVGRGTLLMVAATIAFFAFNLVGRLATARSISVTDWGEFNLGVSFTSFLSVVILLGLNSAVARALASEVDTAEKRRIVLWSLWVSATLSIVASVVTFVLAAPFAAMFHDPPLVPVFQLLAVAVGLGAVTPMIAAIFQGFQDMLPNALFNQVLNPMVFVVAVLGLLHYGWGLTGALVAYVVADVVAFVASFLYYTRKIRTHVPRGTPKGGRPRPELWVSSVSLWGVSSLAFITAYADTLILGAYWPEVAVGYYSTAMALARTLLLGGAALTFVFLPVAARLAREGDLESLRNSYTVASRWIMIVSVPLFLLFFLLPDQSVDALFGPRYAPAALPLQVLATTGFASAVVGPSNACLAGLGRDRPQLATAGLTAVVNVAISFALIPKYGVLGAAVAWGFARALYPVSNLLVLMRDYSIHPFRPALWKPLAASFGVTAPVFLAVRLLVTASWVVYPLFFVGMGAFLLSLLATHSLMPDDLLFLRVAERLTGRRLPRLRAFVAKRLVPAPG